MISLKIQFTSDDKVADVRSMMVMARDIAHRLNFPITITINTIPVTIAPLDRIETVYDAYRKAWDAKFSVWGNDKAESKRPPLMFLD